MPKPVCCQNCLAMENVSSGKSTMWSSPQRDGAELERAPGLSSGHIRYSIKRTGGEEREERERMNERQCSAIFLVGRRRHDSPVMPNFWRHIRDNYIAFIN